MRFDTTSWSVILKATVGGSAEARQALATLCETYWPPVYAFVRRRGHVAPDAEDLTQGYFSRFLEKAAYVKDFRPEAGRFRTFLCASVQHYLANERDRERAQKRGGGRVPFSLDAKAAEEHYCAEPVDRVTPETLFERQWAAAMLARCLARLREAEGSAGRERVELKGFLGADGPESRYSELARQLGTSESAARVAVHRLRRRFGQVLRDEVARTVTDPDDVEADIRWLLTAVRGQG